MRFDRKLLLIAPTIVLVFVFAGLIYTATQLRVLTSVSDSWKERSDYIATVERGEKPLQPDRAVSLLRFELEVEAKRTAAITSIRTNVIMLSIIGITSCLVLSLGVRSVPREHWPRLNLGRSIAE